MPLALAFWPTKLRGGPAIARGLWTLATDAMPSCACVCVPVVGAADTYFYLTMFHVASDMAFEITLSGTQQFTKASGTLSTSTWLVTTCSHRRRCATSSLAAPAWLLCRYHVAVSYSSASQKATLYINGAAATMSRQVMRGWWQDGQGVEEVTGGERPKCQWRAAPYSHGPSCRLLGRSVFRTL